MNSLTTPNKPAHSFSHTLVDLTEQYTPPVAPDSTGTTCYNYNLDRQIIRTLLHDSSYIDVVYDTTGCGCGGVGKPAKIIFDRGETIFKYSETTGQLIEIVSPKLDKLRYKYYGPIPIGTEWVGTVNGRVDLSMYGSDFRLIYQSVNSGQKLSFIYDDDGLLTTAGSLTIFRDSENGMMTGTSLENVSTNCTYNDLGEMVEYTAQYSGSELFHTSYQLDAVGRIEKLTEIVLGKTREFSYYYDTAGRLFQVDRNDTTVSVYEHNDNGNRLSYNGLYSTFYGTYYNHDQMLKYGNADYSYAANGFLKYKAENGDTMLYHYDLLGNLVSVLL